MRFVFEKPGPSLKSTAHEDMTEAEFFDFCQYNKQVRIERNELGQIFIMAPATSETGNRNIILAAELSVWNKVKQLGMAFDSSAIFALPDKSILCPDVSWIRNEKWNAVSKDGHGFAHICPDFVIELKTRADNLHYLKSKMNTWIKNGCSLAWLINIENGTAFIFRKGGGIDKIIGFNSTLSGEDVLPGFKLHLGILK